MGNGENAGLLFPQFFLKTLPVKVLNIQVCVMKELTHSLLQSWSYEETEDVCPKWKIIEED